MPFFVHVSVPLVAAVSGAVLHELHLIIVTEIEIAAVSLGDASLLRQNHLRNAFCAAFPDSLGKVFISSAQYKRERPLRKTEVVSFFRHQALSSISLSTASHRLCLTWL